MGGFSMQVMINNEAHIAEAAREARQLAAYIGFGTVQAYYIATAASELASNILYHAGSGVLSIAALKERPGLELLARDQGPGIAEIDKALEEGYSTAGTLGCGLPGVQRLLDELEIDSQPGCGTTVRGVKWLC